MDVSACVDVRCLCGCEGACGDVRVLVWMGGCLCGCEGACVDVRVLVWT